MPIYRLEKATAKGKRYKITSPEGKIIQFGSATGSTFVDGKDEKTKKAWIARHSKGNPDAWNDKNSPLFYARHLLWNKPTLTESIKDVKERFGIHIKKS